ncbi:Uncharacterised protein [uncultured Ruminococcus sp.]|jgi:hypothetical protein|nr:DUF4355 domain-containing protein [Clostridiales bacterium]SCH61581.1 Uncharacterised protein [uncultured Clostridium sp.]SCH75923.1 Uncharacterised protein [uncultured Ruminococcus sp.]DAP83163.1 MAG TPA: capsid scaffolding protein [Caudoviricetes sp.]
MKKRFDLQLFAEEAATDAAAAPAAEQAEEPAKPEPAPAAVLKEKGAKYTDADVDEILNRKFAEWQKKQQKAVDEAQKLATMNATQKAEYERDQLKKELEELKRISALSEMSKTARKMLSDNGITISDDLLSVMVTEDAETTKAAVDGFSQMFTQAVEAAVKERLKGDPPRKGSGSGVPAMTKEQIMAIRDPELRQKKMLEHKELFNF